jgi:hypothetical protein
MKLLGFDDQSPVARATAGRAREADRTICEDHLLAGVKF